MPARDLQKFGHLVGPHVEPEERVLDIASVQSARASVGVMLGLAGAAGLAIVDRAAVKAGTGNLAKTFPERFPPASTKLLCVTDRRLLFLLAGPDRKRAELAWQAPLSEVIRAERRPRLQIMARFQLHFADGSSLALMTLRRRTIESLATALRDTHTAGS
jgi:hypothetical protein